MLTAVDLSRLPLEDLLAAVARADATTIQTVEALVRAALAIAHQDLDYDDQRHFADFLIELAAREGARRW